MIQWLYRYIFRGIGILLVIGMITALFVAVMSQRARSRQQARPTQLPVSGAIK